MWDKLQESPGFSYLVNSVFGIAGIDGLLEITRGWSSMVLLVLAVAGSIYTWRYQKLRYERERYKLIREKQEDRADRKGSVSYYNNYNQSEI